MNEIFFETSLNVEKASRYGDAGLMARLVAVIGATKFAYLLTPYR